MKLKKEDVTYEDINLDLYSLINRGEVSITSQLKTMTTKDTVYKELKKLALLARKIKNSIIYNRVKMQFFFVSK